MKVLVLSLLRLGDILLHKQVVRSLNARYPGVQVDFAINDSFASCKSLLPEVRHFHLLPRAILQRILVEQEQSAIAAFARLSKFVGGINAEKYDLILDATHNRLSVKLCALLEAREIRYAGNKKTTQNAWESYFNNQFSQVAKSRFHYVDVLTKSLGLDAPTVLLPRTTTAKKIVFQVLTSDIKKNWGLHRFKNLLDRVAQEYPAYESVVVCAPNEKAEIEKVLPSLQYQVRALGLREVQEELKSASLLVSGDTSIQHLAAEVGCPVVSIFIGSADVQKTAPYIKNAMLVQANTDCYPCKHSESCYQSSHLCSASVTVEEIYRNIQVVLKGEFMSRTNGMQGYRTDADQRGFMLIAGQSSEENLAKDFERIIWSFYLSNDWQAPVPAYGSTVYEILNDWTQRYSIKAISQFAVRYQSRVERIEALLTEGKNSFAEISKVCMSVGNSPSGLKGLLEQLKSWHLDAVAAFPEHSDSFLKLQFALHKDYSEAFSLYRELKSSLDEPLNLNLIRKQLLINLVRSLSEKGELYEREFRILS